MPHTLPLADHAEAFRRKYGKDFALHKTFGRRKAMIVDNGLSYADLKGALALLTGGIWRTVDGKDFLDLDPTVDAWRRHYEQADRDAERVARLDIERELAASVRRAFDRQEESANQLDFPGLPKILRAVDPRLAENVARWLAGEIPADEIAEPLQRTIPTDVEAVRAVQAGADFLANVSRNRAATGLELVIGEASVALQAKQGSAAIGMDLHFDPAPPSVGERRNNLATERMATLPVPPGALLGFERLAPAVRISPEFAAKTVRFGQLDADAEALVARLPKLRRMVQRDAEQPTRAQLLHQLATKFNISVVADAYTLSDRLESPSQRVGTLLATSSRAFDCVFVQQGNILLSRRVRWPLDDLAEPPWPYPERWLTAKAEALRQLIALPNPPILPTMSRDDVAALLALTPRQRGRLQSATGVALPPLTVGHEALLAGRNQTLFRDILAPGVWRALVAGSIVRVSTLSRSAQELLRRDNGESEPERGLRIAPPVTNAPDGGQYPLLMLTPTADPENREPLLELPIRWPPR